MTDDETIARIAARVNDGGPVNVHDAEILLRRIGQLTASNEMAAEHMARGREYAARLEAELDRIKAIIGDALGKKEL